MEGVVKEGKSSKPELEVAMKSGIIISLISLVRAGNGAVVTKPNCCWLKNKRTYLHIKGKIRL